MSDPTPPVVTPPASPVSPTGQALIPPAVWVWVALAFSAAIPVLGTLALVYPANTKIQLALLIVGSVAGALGITSTGARKAAPLVLLCLALPAMSGCATVQATAKAAEPALVDCATVAVTGAITAAVAAALAETDNTWPAALAAAEKQIGPAVVCAIRALIAGYEQASAPPEPALATAIRTDHISMPKPEPLEVTRARVWLQAHP